MLAGLGALLPSRGTARDPKDVSARLHEWLAAHSPTWALLDPDTGKEAGAGAKPLGEGSFGMVFLARDEQRSLALKVPRDSAKVASLQEECDKVSTIFKAIEAGGAAKMHGEHHVMHCVKSYMEADPPFIALEYAGMSGQEALVSEPQSPDKVHGYLKQMVLALAAFNEAAPPQIHHDLKWTNTAVDTKGCLKLIDLDTVLPGRRGEWENTRKMIPFSPLYAPPEINEYMKDAQVRPYALNMLHDATGTTQVAAMARKAFGKPEEFHNFACGTKRGAHPEDPCPLAHSWDIYSAGVMAVSSLCGFDAYGYAKNAGDPGMDRAVKQVQESAGLSRAAAQQIMGFVLAENELKGQALWRKLAAASEGMAELARHGKLALNESWAWKEKLAYCTCLPKASLTLLDRMVSSNPAERPRPQELLESVLFSSVATGCAADPPAESADPKFAECRSSGRARATFASWLLVAAVALCVA